MGPRVHQNAGLARRERGNMMSGNTFVLVELLDPTDSQYFKTIMKKKGLRDLTPPFGGNTFRSNHPTVGWMKKVAGLDPDWWYISGHFGRTPYYEGDKKDQQKQDEISLSVDSEGRERGLENGKPAKFEIWKRDGQNKEKIAEINRIVYEGKASAKWKPPSKRDPQKEQYSYTVKIDDVVVMEETPIELKESEADEEPSKQEKTIVPLFPNKLEKLLVTIESMNAINIDAMNDRKLGRIKYRSQTNENKLGLQVKTTREIEILAKNGSILNTIGKTSITSVEPYSSPKDRYKYKPITMELAGSGTRSEQDLWYDCINVKTESTWREKACKELEIHKTPFCFPKTYPMKIDKSAYVHNLEKEKQHAFGDSFNLIFQSEETHDKSIGYCVASRWEVGEEWYDDIALEHGIVRKKKGLLEVVQDEFVGDGIKTSFVMTQERYHKGPVKAYYRDNDGKLVNLAENLDFTVKNEEKLIEFSKAPPAYLLSARRKDKNVTVKYWSWKLWAQEEFTCLFKPTYIRFRFPKVDGVLLKNGWHKKYDYATARAFGNEETYTGCPVESKSVSVSPPGFDDVKVKLIERIVDRSQDAGFFNKSYYDNEYQSKDKSSIGSWRIQMEYAFSRNDIKSANFFEGHGSGSYKKAKVVLLVSCNTLALPSVRKYLTELFPKDAIFLGHVHKNPTNATPIIKNFLNKYFSDPAKARANDLQHTVSSWLSYNDTVKGSIMKRGYGLAALNQEKVYGIDLHDSQATLAGPGETIQRLKLKSIQPPSECKPGCIVDVLLVWDSKGRVLTNKAMYEGKILRDYSQGEDPYKNTDEFPFLTSQNLLNNRGY